MTGLKMEFRAEAFNTFNRVQFAPPDTTINDSTFGQITVSRTVPGPCNSGYDSSSEIHERNPGQRQLTGSPADGALESRGSPPQLHLR